MTKKTVRVMMMTFVATVLGLSVVIESAEAKHEPDHKSGNPVRVKRKGNDHSKTGDDGASILQQFRLVNSTQDSFLITEDDSTENNPDLGLFIGAIENYTEGSGRLCTTINTNPSEPDVFEPDCSNSADKNFLDSSGYPIFWIPFTSTTNPVNGDLKAQYFPGGTDPFFGITEDGNFGYDVIAYTIFKEGSAEPSLNFRLSVDDLLELDPSNSRNTMIYQAVNDLEYILNNNLLGLENTIAVDPVPNPAASPGYDYSGRAVLQNQADIPEPDTKVGSLVALGILSAGTLIKRKVKQR